VEEIVIVLLGILLIIVVLVVVPSSKKGLKKCPACAEFVKNEALKCKSCGFDFRGSSPPSLRSDARR